MDIQVASASDLDTTTMYRILRLRAEVFGVEQQCAYNDLDGRDLEPATVHLWVDDPSLPTVAAAVRVLTETDGSRAIGRVVTSERHRQRGLSTGLIARALEIIGPATHVELHAQSHLEDWYARRGFTRIGDEFIQAGIPHVLMVRNP